MRWSFVADGSKISMQYSVMPVLTKIRGIAISCGFIAGLSPSSLLSEAVTVFIILLAQLRTTSLETCVLAESLV